MAAARLKLRSIIIFLFSLGLISLVAATAIHKAQNKPFWFDESYEIFTTCHLKTLDILKADSTLQSNRSPLYFIFQNQVLSNITDFGAPALVTTRVISIISASLLGAFLFIIGLPVCGVFLSIVSAFTLISQDIFYQYASETRPYAMWILVYTLMVYSTLKLSTKHYSEAFFKHKILFIISCLCVTLIIATGFIQAGCAMLACLFIWGISSDQKKLIRPFFRFALPLGVACIAIQLYYTSQGIDANESYIKGSDYDLFYQIGQGNLDLLKMPIRLLLPKPERDGPLTLYLTNILVLAGLFRPFHQWKKRRSLDDANRFMFNLSIIILFQLFATTVTIFIIGYLRYWFVQRIFLNLIICQAFLVLSGGFYLLEICANKQQKKAVSTVFLIILTAAIFWHIQKNKYISKHAKELSATCETLSSPLEQTLPQPDAFKEEVFFEIYSNARRVETAAFIGRQLKACGHEVFNKGEKLYLSETDQYHFELTETAPTKSKQTFVCGNPIIYTKN